LSPPDAHEFNFCFSSGNSQPEVGQSGHSASSGDLISGNYKKEASEAISRWNPFEDTTPFSHAVTEEEDLFGAEFDKIRQEGETIVRLNPFS
jgi:hypothetical protein